jgi:hypothetical protein
LGFFCLQDAGELVRIRATDGSLVSLALRNKSPVFELMDSTNVHLSSSSRYVKLKPREP